MTDYHAMWEDLGMDLDTHDLLCAALPQAFGDIYLSQKNRPEGMSFYDFVVSEIPMAGCGPVVDGVFLTESAAEAAKAGRQGVRHVLRVRAG